MPNSNNSNNKSNNKSNNNEMNKKKVDEILNKLTLALEKKKMGPGSNSPNNGTKTNVNETNGNNGNNGVNNAANNNGNNAANNNGNGNGTNVTGNINEGFTNFHMFGLHINRTCLILILVYILLFMYKEDIMKMKFVKNLMK